MSDKKTIPADGRTIMWKNCLIASLISAAVALFIMLAVSAAVYSSADPNSHVEAAGIACMYLSFLICGIISAKLTHDGFVCGIISGAVLALVSLVCALALDSYGDMSFFTEFLLRISAILASGIGGFLASGRHGRKKKHKVRR